jgi:SAM-dependent methyltransferase
MIYHDKQELIERTIQASDRVLDVGFYGQGVNTQSPYWPHRFILKRTKDVYGVDLDVGEGFPPERYTKASAENFSFGVQFDVIFAGDLIEHLSNPGLFLNCCHKALKQDGRLILTTPNAFNLFNMAGKLTKHEPTVNHDHTCYFNSRTLKKLLEKNDFKTEEVSYLYTLHVLFDESWKKKFLNVVYKLLSLFTDKYIETLVVIARKS